MSASSTSLPEEHVLSDELSALKSLNLQDAPSVSREEEDHVGKAARIERVYRDYRVDHLSQVVLHVMNVISDGKGHPKLQVSKTPEKDAPREEKRSWVADCIKKVFERALQVKNSQFQTGDLTSHERSVENAEIKAPYSELPLNNKVNPQSIRVAELVPATEGSPIKIKLLCLSSPQDQAYEALSYVWGSPTPAQTIDVNGVNMEITPNLFDALSSLRTETQSRFLWVDAICINQADNDEKSFQVTMMDEIYRAAEKVVVYLGPETANTHAMFDFLAQEHPDVISGKGKGKATEENTKPKDTALSLSFEEFMSRTWWTRLWVLQEVYCASDYPLWVCGKRSVEGWKLCQNSQVLAANIFNTLVMRNKLDSSDFWNQTNAPLTAVGQHLRSFVQSTVPKYGSVQLPRHFYSSLDRVSTVSHDIVFAARGIVDGSFRDCFVPQYNEPVEELFVRLATWLLVMDGWIDMFWFFPFKSSASTPSWAPDFSKRTRTWDAEHTPERGRSIRHAPVYIAIYERGMRIGGTFVDELCAVYPIGDEPYLKGFFTLWHLDQIFYSSKKHLSQGVEQSSRTHVGPRRLLEWCTTLRGSITRCLPHHPVLLEILCREFDPFLSNLHLGLASTLALANQSFIPGETAELRKLRMGILVRELKFNVAMLLRNYNFLISLATLDTEEDFIGGCVFDLPNLASKFTNLATSTSSDTDTSASTESAHSFSSEYLNLKAALVDGVTSTGELFQRTSIIVNTIGKVQDVPYPSEPDDIGPARQSLDFLVSFYESCLSRLRTQREEYCDLVGQEQQERDPYSASIFENPSSETLFRNEAGDTIPVKSIIARTLARREWNVIEEKLEQQLTTWRQTFKGPNIRGDLSAQFRGRSFFLTKRGFQGLTCPGVGAVHTGDHIITVGVGGKGSKFPLVLRPNSGSQNWSLIGCAIMDFMRIDGDKEGDSKHDEPEPDDRQTFTIS